MHGHCHCGAVRLTVPAAPRDVTECRCSICRRYGALWAYYPSESVEVEGPTDAYVWGRGYITYLRCRTCGCVMCWRPRGKHPECGVNARTLDGFDLFGAERIVEEDASV